MKLSEVRVKGAGVRGARGLEITRFESEKGWSLNAVSFGIVAEKGAESHLIPWSMVATPMPILKEAEAPAAPLKVAK